MSAEMTRSTALTDERIGIRMKLSTLWASLTLCYLYGDYFGLYVPGKLEGMLAGIMGSLGATTQGVLLNTAAMMAIPCTMVFLSTVMPPRLNRGLNIVFGSLFTVIMIATMPGAWRFYLFLGVIEIILTASIVWYAWTWPKTADKRGVAAAEALSPEAV